MCGCEEASGGRLHMCADLQHLLPPAHSCRASGEDMMQNTAAQDGTTEAGSRKAGGMRLGVVVFLP